MAKKGFLVKVELDIQRVSCPGVWLCTNGKVSLQMKLLDSKVQTKLCRPVFPMPCHEKYVFTKTFFKERKLADLQNTLSNERFYAELIHWKTCDEGYVLAKFHSGLDELLYPSACKGDAGGKETDLLMEPSSLFPGVIAPKIEISTKTTIEEILRDLPNISHAHSVPKKEPSQGRRGHPRKVCHSVEYSRAQKSSTDEVNLKRPPFVYRKVSDDFLLRKSNALDSDVEPAIKSMKPKHSCHCYCSSKRTTPFFSKTHSVKFVNDHTENCSICTTYDSYFIPDRSASENVYDYPQTCPCCREVSISKGRNICDCADVREKYCGGGLVQKLHSNLRRVLDTDCIECRDLLCHTK